jgi:hypothetical protein
MSMWNNLWEAITGHAAVADVSPNSFGNLVNPATGLPMLGDDGGGVDVGGSPFGIDNHALLSSHDIHTGGGVDGF